MKKILSLALVATLIFVLLSGCNSTDTIKEVSGDSSAKQNEMSIDSSTNDSSIETQITDLEKINSLTADDYIGMTVKEFEEIFGSSEPTETGGLEGSYYRVYKDFAPYYIFYFNTFDEENLKDDNVISSVHIRDGGRVNDKVTVGMHFDEIKNALNLSDAIKSGEDDMYDYPTAFFTTNTKKGFKVEVFVHFEGKDDISTQIKFICKDFWE